MEARARAAGLRTTKKDGTESFLPSSRWQLIPLRVAGGDESGFLSMEEHKLPCVGERLPRNLTSISTPHS